MKAGRSSLRRRMLFTLLGCFVPMVVVISLLFVRSFLAQRQADIEALRYAAEDIRVTLDRFADGVYSVSDAFSTDERLIEILDRDYSADPLAKQYAVTYTNGALFESYSRLVHQEKIAAIYLPARREVFDFRDPNQVTTLLVKQFEAMQVDASDKLGRFFFYPLQKNFLSTETYGEARRDMVVLGSRRVYSALKSGYPYVHIFAIEEQTLYEHYQYQARRLGAAVYVLTEEGALISSTDEAAVAAGQVPAEVTAAAAALALAGWRMAFWACGALMLAAAALWLAGSASLRRAAQAGLSGPSGPAACAPQKEKGAARPLCRRTALAGGAGHAARRPEGRRDQLGAQHDPEQFRRKPCLLGGRLDGAAPGQPDRRLPGRLAGPPGLPQRGQDLGGPDGGGSGLPAGAASGGAGQPAALGGAAGRHHRFDAGGQHHVHQRDAGADWPQQRCSRHLGQPERHHLPRRGHRHLGHRRGGRGLWLGGGLYPLGRHGRRGAGRLPAAGGALGALCPGL